MFLYFDLKFIITPPFYGIVFSNFTCYAFNYKSRFNFYIKLASILKYYTWQLKQIFLLHTLQITWAWVNVQSKWNALHISHANGNFKISKFAG